MIEENETPGIDPTQGGIEHDLLAQRRARRAELSDPGLIRRAETAEATVRTLETHLASLKQRLEETTVEQRRVAEQLADREREVRRVKQREYAEQQLRVEAEDHAERLSREKRAELEELHRRLSVSEQDARELIDQLEDVRRELAEAQQVAAAERVAMGRGEQELSDREAELQRREFALEQARVETERRLSAARDFERRASALREQAQQGRDLLSGRLLALEQRTAEVQEELERQRQAREHSQLTLERARESYSGLRAIVGELERAAKQLRGAIEQERSSLAEQLERQREQLSAKHASELQNQNDQMTREHAAELHRNAQQTIDLQREREQLERRYTAELEQMRARVRELEQELEQTAAELRRHEAQTQKMPTGLSAEQTIETETAEEKRKQEMTSALAAAVERLRARAAAAGEPPAQTPTAPQQSTPVLTDTSVSAPVPNPDFATRTVLSPQRRKSWLAPAIRSLAKHGDPVKVQHAAELILELLPAQRLVFDRPLTYAGEINGVGSFIVKLEGERGTVEKVGGPPREKVDFLLKGNIEDFGELAAGGARRRRSGLKVHGSKRLARKLLASRRTPLMLSDLANAKISVWPGLLLQAMAEAIDPAWTKGQRFVVSFEIAVSRSVPIYVSVRDGEPVIVIPDWDGDPPVTVALSEYALLCLLAGVALPAGEEVRVSGQSELLGRFLDWTDRAQGLIAAG